ncbi:hypothetical protein M407DRAFT_188158 [Tulasnella calospora MUT 4182]|uniref:Uncharacterized protein n=1 Tax=Tulasnella calospora MUT 4182 TaxID=1051891 RepID=A0A0C3M2G6_9AGAM|nr:hypothetical protein M407DRAFT_188158 [Tulasnella calospora MUT 4182]
MFKIHGCNREIGSQKLTLMYTVEHGGGLSAKVLRLDNLDTETLGDLYKTIDKASAVGDTSKRSQITRSCHVIASVLASISAFCKIGVEANLHCLKVMAKDDYSEKTSDTEAEEDYAGSLVVGVATGCEGGKLVLFKGDREAAFGATRASWKLSGRPPSALFASGTCQDDVNLQTIDPSHLGQRQLYSLYVSQAC